MGVPVRVRNHRQDTQASAAAERSRRLDLARLVATYIRAFKESLAQEPRYFEDLEFEEAR